MIYRVRMVRSPQRIERMRIVLFERFPEVGQVQGETAQLRVA